MANRCQKYRLAGWTLLFFDSLLLNCLNTYDQSRVRFYTNSVIVRFHEVRLSIFLLTTYCRIRSEPQFGKETFVQMPYNSTSVRLFFIRDCFRTLLKFVRNSALLFFFFPPHSRQTFLISNGEISLLRDWGKNPDCFNGCSRRGRGWGREINFNGTWSLLSPNKNNSSHFFVSGKNFCTFRIQLVGSWCLGLKTDLKLRNQRTWI